MNILTFSHMQMHQQQMTLESIVTKEESAYDGQSLLLSQCFQLFNDYTLISRNFQYMFLKLSTEDL